MAYIKLGTAAAEAIGMTHVKSIVIRAKATATHAVISNPAAGVEMALSVPANSCQQILAPGQANAPLHFSSGCTITTTGDADSFVRID